MKFKVIFPLLMILSFGTLAQELEQSGWVARDTSARATFIELGVGVKLGTFRDFATSPLIYSGPGIHAKIGRNKKNNIFETDANFIMAAGSYSSLIENEVHYSSINTFTLNYSYLRGIRNWNTAKCKFLVGGMLSAMGNYRFNEALMNNNLGIEAFINLQAAAKVILDISRTEQKNKKLLFIKYSLFPRSRSLTYQFNVGVVNSSYRNGYAYISQGAITNRDGWNIFDNHELRVFSGAKISSSLAYEISLNNGNRVKLAYDWEAYKTGGDLDVFEMSNHLISLALLFKTNR